MYTIIGGKYNLHNFFRNATEIYSLVWTWTAPSIVKEKMLKWHFQPISDKTGCDQKIESGFDLVGVIPFL